MKDKAIELFLKELVEGGIFDSIGDGISIQDTNFKILYQNKTCKDNMGEHVGEYCYKAYEHMDKTCEYCPLDMVFKDGEVHKSVRKVSTDKGISYFEIVASPLRDAIGKVVAGIEVARDITERKKIEEDLQKSSLYLDSVNDTLIVINAEKEIIKVNKEFSRLLGYSPDEVLGKSVFKIFSEEEKQKHLSKMEEGVATRKPQNFETVALTKSGEKVPIYIRGSVIFNTDGEPEGFIGIFRDITERKHMENVLRNSARRFEILHKISNDALMIRPIEEIIQVVLGYIREAVSCVRVSIVMVDSKKNQAIVIAVDSETKTRMGKGVRFPLKEFGIEEGLYLGENTAVDDIGTLSNPSAVDKLLMAEGIRSYIKIPLMDLDELTGVINIGCDKSCPFTLQDLKISREITDLLALVMRSKRADEALKKLNDKLEELVKVRTTELEETNTALKVLLKQIEGDKDNFEEQISSNIKQLIMPYIKKLKKNKAMSKELAYLNIVETNLKQITTPFSQKLSSEYLGFTPKEIQITSLIRDGRQDKDISETLEVSLETIKTHRQNIRKKLGIHGKKINMRSYLMSLSR